MILRWQGKASTDEENKKKITKAIGMESSLMLKIMSAQDKYRRNSQAICERKE